MSELRIVLADDHEVVRAGLRMLVDSSPGMRVVAEASNGQEAVDRTRALRPDLVLMDVSMPLLDGAAATELLSRELPEVVARRLAWGESNKDIATSLGISIKTVETYRARVMEKLGMNNRADLTRYGLRRGWLSES